MVSEIATAFPSYNDSIGYSNSGGWNRRMTRQYSVGSQSFLRDTSPAWRSEGPAVHTHASRSVA